jgi:integrase
VVEQRFQTVPLNVADAAKLLGVSQSWVRRHKHELPVVPMGGLVRFDAALLSEYLRGKVSAGTRLKSERTTTMSPRYQRGYVFQKGKVKTWYGVFREDVQTPAGMVRVQRKVRLGTVAELPRKNAATNKLAVEMGITPSTDMTFQQLTDRWQTAVGPTYKASTLEHYTNALRAYVLPTWKDKRITAVSREAIQNFLAEQSKTYSTSTLRSMRAVLRLTLVWADSNGWIENPCTGVKLPVKTCEDRTVKRHNLTPAQIAALASMLPEPYATLVLFISQTGVRIGEAVAVKVSDFDGDVVQICRRIYNGKVGDVKSKKSVRALPVSGELKARMLQIAGSEWIFSSEAGTPVDDGNALRRYVRPACVKLGIELGGWHDFRHTLTTRLRKARVHPRVLSDILGHSKVNLAMETYDRSDAEDIAEALLPERNSDRNGVWVTLGNSSSQNQPLQYSF